MTDQFGPYQLDDVIGVGEVATVYRARDRRANRAVALKVLRKDSPVANAQAYFDNEVGLLRQLDHPNVPLLLEALDGAIAMQLIPGEDLQTRLNTSVGFFPARTVIGWAAQVCDALDYLHQQRVVFRDLKPAHIMVTPHHAAYLIDFNLAVRLPPDGRLENADKVGTEGFAAPEQYRGSVSPASDIYGLGATLHYLLTRVDPRQNALFAFEPPRAINPALSDPLEAAVMRALSRDEAARFPSAAALKTALLAAR